MGLAKSSTLYQLLVLLIAAGVFLILLFLARLFRWTFRRLSEQLHQYVPRRISYAVGLIAAVFTFGMAVNGILFSLILEGADASYKQWDRQVQPELEQPADSMKTGSEASLLNWDEMGRYGREFVAEGPSKVDLKKFSTYAVREPIRVYAGIQSGSFEERAELALQELKRVNAFDRAVLVLNTPTGTGWVDPAAIEPIEYLFRGDIATVSAQYSYLPSALSLLFEGEYGEEMAQTLFQKVYGYWSGLPEEDRPKLYLHGLSLGALNSDRSFDLFDIIDDPFHGILWSGPPFRSETWKHITAQRRPDSPAWLPRFRNDAVVRFANQDGGLAHGKARWSDFRIAYLQYASDPIVFFDPLTFWREPEWMIPPRGFDVSDKLKWYPVVTMMQLVADTFVGTEAPAGYGHEYASVDYLQSWLELAEPQNWDKEELDQLYAFFAKKDERKTQSKDL